MASSEHLLALKVLRFTRPSLNSTLPLTCDNKDLPGNVFNSALQQDITTVPGLETIAVSQFLLIPQNPVKIYLGETFSSYVCVYNETEQIVCDICVKVYLETTSQQILLHEDPPKKEIPRSQLKADEIIDIVIHHEVKEVGTHILMCEVAYVNLNGDPKTLRKFFKIDVLKPLDVKTKVYAAENDDIYLETQVVNLTNGSICLEKVAFDVSQNFSVIELNTKVNGESIFGSTNLLQPSAVSQFLYCLTSKQKRARSKETLQQNSESIGKLDIVWRSNFCEKGRLQTCQLQRVMNPLPDLHASIIEIPNFVLIERSFTYKCKFTNYCDRLMNLILTYNRSEEFCWVGISGIKLEPLQPYASTVIEIELIPLSRGLRTLPALHLLEVSTKSNHLFENLAQVFVLLNDDAIDHV